MDKEEHMRVVLFFFFLLFIISLNKEIKASDEVFMDVSVSPSIGYVNSPIRYKLKLYDRVGILSSHLSLPQSVGLDFIQLGKERRYVEEYKGDQYLVLEWEYVFFLPFAGDFLITGPSFSGEINSNILSGEPEFYTRKGEIKKNPFQNMKFGGSKKILIEGRKLLVRGISLPSKEDIFVAEGVSITERWDPALGEISKGKPLTREFRLKARGSNPEIFPNFSVLAPSGMKSFYGEPVKNIQVKDKDIYVNILQSIIFISDKDGEYTFPEYKFLWFNSRSGKVEEVIFPEFKVKVFGLSEEERVFFPAQRYEETRAFYEDYKLYKWYLSLDKESLKETLLLILFLGSFFELVFILFRKYLRKRK